MSEILSGIVEKARGSITDTTDLLAAIAGAGATGALIEVIRSWLPDQTKDVADEVLATVAGFLLFYYGDRVHRLLVPFGFGAFLAGIGAWSSEWVAGIILMLKKKE